MTATPADILKRTRCEGRRAVLEVERSTFIPHWRELSDFILPRRSRFTTFDVNRGDKRNQKIIDSTATESAGTLSAGMMAGMSSPSRPWFRLTVPDATLAEQADVKAWLFTVQRRMESIFLRSNLYNKLPTLYGDAGVFATGAMGVFEDDETVIYCYDFPIGSFSLGNDAKCRVRTFTRQFRLTVQQVVERWGNVDPKTGQADFERQQASTVSERVRNAWTIGQRETWVDIVHMIQPNDAYDGVKIEARFKKFESLYYETAATDSGFLEHSGFDEFPILAARWDVSGEDVYGTNCPGMKALGDIKQLQTGEKRAAQAIEKSINPPLTGPSELQNKRVSVLPGDVTYLNTRDGQQGLKPIYELRFPIDQLEAKQQQVRTRIRHTLKEDLFLMLIQNDRAKTATEVDELTKEKMLALGPVLEQLNQDVFDPLIDRTFAIMVRRGLIPDAPQALQGVPLHVEYISIMAQAQRMVGLSSLDRFAGFVSQVAQVAPDILDRVNEDELVDQYADGTGVPPTILRTPEEADARRQQRAQAAAQSQATDNMSKVAGAAKNLSQAPLDNNSALAQLVGQMRAKNTLKAAQTPVGVQ